MMEFSFQAPDNDLTNYCFVYSLNNNNSLPRKPITNRFKPFYALLKFR